MINTLQVIALIFIFVMFYFSYLHFKRREIGVGEFIFLILAWIGAILITIFPSVFGSLSHKIDIIRTFDLAVVGGFLFVIPLVYLSYIRTKRTEKKLEDLIRSDALKNSRKNK